MWRTRTYLDEAASASISPRALSAFARALVHSGNPSAVHTEGRKAKEVLEDARVSIARLAGTKPEHVTFTSGATEANNLAITGSIEQCLAEAAEPTTLHVLYQEGAHASITEPIRALERRGVQTQTIPLHNGQLNLDVLTQSLTSGTVLVCVELVTSEVGMRTHTRDVERILKSHAPQAKLLVDASQAPYIELIERTHTGADLLVLDAQKIGGVRGCGVLIRSPRTVMQPILFGGSQEQGLRAGTASPALAHAFAVALGDAQRTREVFAKKAQTMRTALVTEITASISQIEVNEGKEQAPHILNISLLGRDTDYLVALLDEAGFAVSTKSACEIDSIGSRGVYALTNDKERSATTLRISWGPHTSPRQLQQFAHALLRAVSFLDHHKL